MPWPSMRVSPNSLYSGISTTAVSSSASAHGGAAKGCQHRLRVSDDDDLCQVRRRIDQRCQGRQQIWVQRGLRLVEHHQRRRLRAQQRGGPQQETQCAVGQFGCTQRAQHAALVQLKVEEPVVTATDTVAPSNASATARWRSSNPASMIVWTAAATSPPSSRQHRGAGADLRAAAPVRSRRRGIRRRTASRAAGPEPPPAREARRGGRIRRARCGTAAATGTARRSRGRSPPPPRRSPGPRRTSVELGRSRGPANTTSRLISGSRANNDPWPAHCGSPRSTR